MADSAASSPDVGRATILVVDDDRLLLRMALEILRGEGHQALGVERAADALPLLAAQRDLQLLITDINMPGMNGLDLLALASNRHPKLRLMAISGRCHVAAGSMPAGTELLGKPFTAGQLLARVERILRE